MMRPAQSAEFRRVLGHLPTGVVAVTAIDGQGAPAGMTVGSFVSVSLNPPLVALLPDRNSSTFPRIREAGSFCANVLGAGQEQLCRGLAAKGSDKFAGVSWRPAASGSPILDGVIAWIDCDIVEVTEAGDHYFVLARVRELDVVTDEPPLVFFQGGYGEFSAPSLTAAARPELLMALRAVDDARPTMESLARDLSVECLASVVVRDRLEVVGSAGRRGSRIGQRTPFAAPIGAGLAAWADEDVRGRWLDRAVPDDDARVQLEQMLARVRSRGWSIVVDGPEQRALEAAVARLGIATGHSPDEDWAAVAAAAARLDLADYDPKDLDAALRRGVRSISAPVFNQDGSVALNLSLYGFVGPLDRERFDFFQGRLAAAVEEVASVRRVAPLVLARGERVGA